MRRSFSVAAIAAVFALTACAAFTAEKVNPETAVVVGVINDSQLSVAIDIRDTYGTFIRAVGVVEAGDTAIFMVPAEYFRFAGRYLSLEAVISRDGPNVINRRETGNEVPSDRVPHALIGSIPSLEPGTLIRLRIAPVLSETPYPSIISLR